MSSSTDSVGDVVSILVGIFAIVGITCIVCIIVFNTTSSDESTVEETELSVYSNSVNSDGLEVFM